MSFHKIFIFTISIFLSYHFCYSNEPEWFGHLKSKSFEIIGYGKAQDLDKAIIQAKKNIAEIIQTQITSGVEIKTTESSSGKINEMSDFYLKAKTDVVLNDLITLKQEKQEEIWYVALMYENLPIDRKFVKKISKFSLKSEKQNRYLSSTPLISSINVKLNLTLDLKVIRLNQLWYLNYNDILLPLNNFDFERLFIGSQSNLISLKTIPSNILKDGDRFAFKILPKASGFISIINVFENGEVFVILDNLKVTKNKEIIFPDKNSSIELVSSLLEKKISTFDLYVILIDKEKIDLNRLQPTGDEINLEEKYFKFHEVIDIMDKYEFCSTIVRTSFK